MKKAAPQKNAKAAEDAAPLTTSLENSEAGEIKIHENVISSLARRAALGVEGVSRLSGSILVDNIAEIVGSRRMQDRAVSIEILEDNRVAVELKVNILLGYLLNFNYMSTPKMYLEDNANINYIHGMLKYPQSVIFGYGDELDDNYTKLQKLNDNEYLRNIKSIRYLELDSYRSLLRFIESAPFQICIMGHSCGNSDRTLLNTLFEHRNCYP